MARTRRTRTRKLARPYRVLNLDARGSPLAMLNDAQRWCLSADEAGDLAAYARTHGYHVEIVCSSDELEKECAAR